MISRRAKIFAAATLSALVVASPALAGGGWGYGPRHGWGYGHWGYGGYNRGAGWGAAGALGGLAVGLIASQAAAPYPYYYGPRCRVVDEPLYDAYGYVAGYRPTQVCD